MEVYGLKHTVENVRVDVDPRDVICKLKDNWLISLFGTEGTEYLLNSDGEWFYWDESYHGSDSTVIVREATNKEKEIMAAYCLMFEQVELHNK